MIPAVANHLWQSTLVALIAAILSFALRRNSASLRYGIWMIASVKFLLPFSLLIDLGNSLARPEFAAPAPGLILISEFSRPFATERISLGSVSAGSSEAPSADFPFTLFFIWIVGALLFFTARWLKVRRAAAILKRTIPIAAGRDAEIFKTALLQMGMDARRVCLCRADVVPCVIGHLRPTVLLPECLSGRMQDEELQAVLVHELSHVRRRDNLTRSLHAFVEIAFWFYPLVRWIGTRLNEERERACDEAALRLGADGTDYAQAILKVCEIHVSGFRNLAAGFDGGNLEKRIEAIMKYPNLKRLGFGRLLVLAATAGAAVVFPIVAGYFDVPVIHAEISRLAPLGSREAVLFETSSPEIARVPTEMRQLPAPGEKSPAEAPASILSSWAGSEVRSIISDVEAQAFQKLQTDEEREKFIEIFWARRDPNPATPQNEFREEFNRRVNYANDHFTTGIRGSQTDRGRMYILLGPPDEVETHASGGTYYRAPKEGGGVTLTFPFERWRYRRIDGKGDNIIYEFVDTSMSGDYRLEYDPGAKDALQNRKQ